MNTTELLSRELAQALAPLLAALGDPGRFRTFMYSLGWDCDAHPPALTALGDRITVFINASGPDAAGQIMLLADDLQRLATEATAWAPASVDTAVFASEFPRQLLDRLIVDHLLSTHPTTGNALLLVGLIRIDQVDADLAKKRISYTRRMIAWELLASAVGNPSGPFNTAYGFGGPNFNAYAFIENCDRLFSCLGWPVWFERPVDVVGAALDDLAQASIYDGDQLSVHPFGHDNGTSSTQVGIDIRPLPASGTGLPGFSIVPALRSTLHGDIPITDELTYRMAATGFFSGGFGISVRPGNVSFRADLLGTGDTGIAADLAARMGFRLTSPNDPGYALLTNEEGSGIFLKAVEAMLGARLSTKGDPEILIEGSLIGGKIIVNTEKSDGFMKVLLGGEDIEADFDLSLGWSSLRGVYLGEGNGIEILIPLHIQLGPLGITAVMIGLKPNGRQIEIPLAFDANAALGPLGVVVKGVGVKAFINSPTEQNGNAGPIDLTFGFKPPDGAGLSINAGVVSGGGYLECFPERGEYAGIAQVNIAGMVSVTAMGIITTRMPDGSDGFSLLLIMSVSFEPGIQLSYGFTLGGVGGIIGLNRTMVAEALATGARTGTINAIMFPTGDIIPQAPRIISDLRAIFPPQEGTFLIGPMVKIGWGTPTLISVSMGVIIQFPVFSMAIIGVVRCGLPTAEQAILNLQVAFIGVVDPAKGHLFFFAALFESKLLTMTLEGEAGLLLAWGDEPNFVITVGGFHPRFDPPPLPFPTPARLALTILNESFGKIRAEAYFAITSNTAQFGARLELFFGNNEFKLDGHLQFDALLRFSPFYLIAEMSGNLNLKVFGFDACTIHIEISLEGPTPWTAHVEGSIKAGPLEYKVNFTESWGSRKDTSLPPIAVKPLLENELKKLENWTTELPPSNKLLVSLRDRNETASPPPLVMHPVGTLRFSQRLLPIGITIDKLGNQKTSDVKRFDIEAASGLRLKRVGGGQERFAMAQFKDMSDAKKLSSPAFELEDGGIVLGVDDALKTSWAACRKVRYEEHWIDSACLRHQRAQQNAGLGGHRVKRSLQRGFDQGLFAHHLNASAIVNHGLSAARGRKLDPFGEKTKVRDAVRFVVADMDTNRPFHTGTRRSYVGAEQAMARAIAVDPALHGRLTLIPESELIL